MGHRLNGDCVQRVEGVQRRAHDTSGVPVYFWTRRVASPVWAVLATALTLSMPAFVYTGMLMTENAFFPAFVLATFAIALSLERPTLLRQGLVFAAIGLACLVRVQGLVLFAMLPVAIVVKVLLDLRATGTSLDRALVLVGETRRYAASLAVLGLLVLGYFVVQLAKGAAFAGGSAPIGSPARPTTRGSAVGALVPLPPRRARATRWGSSPSAR